MDALLGIILGFLVAFALHELTHLLVILYYKIPIKAIILTKWSAFGFLVDNESFINNGKIMLLIHFLPMIWCLVIFININDPFLLMFPIVNLSGGIGDMYYYFKLTSMSSTKRIEWAEANEVKIKKSIVWMRPIGKEI